MTSSTTSARLAVSGGSPSITRSFTRYNSIGEEEVRAATAVVRSGALSRFLGAAGPDFLGGPKVQEFERAWETAFGVKHAVTVNSLTSGLVAGLGALGLEPGDEVIVSPWTMCASATAPLHWNAIPVFADIDRDTYCLDPASVEACVTPHTKAIVPVDIYGQTADMPALRAIAAKHGLTILSDTAQAPGAGVGQGWAGTLADIGGYSLNYHKHIHTGEGGVMVTNDDRLAQRMRLIRNHAEAAVPRTGEADLCNMIGHNFRLGEIEAAIGIEQLRKLPGLISARQRAARRLSAGLSGLAGLGTPKVRPGASHVYYIFAMQLDVDALGVSRDKIVAALLAEGVPHIVGGYANVHRLPIFTQKIAYGKSGFPWNSPICRRDVPYGAGVCPVAERLHDHTCMIFEICQVDLSDGDVDAIIGAFQKVWANIDDLR